ncbi:electron transport complex subunit A [Marinicella pacifica]|uniref:Ion-translocating oxidoreductase complex subunit A n=1 Tax=Marinicella pacifica TaxID=1171543 RepID=A0A917CNF5_9GAMM|nr:electron transport complex subunit RsxA [Marinicella pacifica]GGF91990.1 electron transport complex subunit A [Marinicella pacifica]
MTTFFVIFISAAFVNNFVLVRFLGLCPFMGVSSQYKSALGMAYATAFVLTLSSIVSYLVNEYLLVPLQIEYLKTLSFILVIAVTVQMTEMILHKSSPLLYQVLGLFLPLITTNCAVLGVALLNVQQQNSLLESAVFGFGAAFGFGLVLVLFSAIRERLEMAHIPASFRGIPIALITAGIMALAFMGFGGMVST